MGGTSNLITNVTKQNTSKDNNIKKRKKLFDSDSEEEQ